MKVEPEWSWNKHKVIEDLHNDKWSESLLENDFRKIFNYVLSRTEKFIVLQKIDGFTDGEIAIQKKVEIQTIKRHITTIKKKYRIEDWFRVDKTYVEFFAWKKGIKWKNKR